MGSRKKMQTLWRPWSSRIFWIPISLSETNSISETVPFSRNHIHWKKNIKKPGNTTSSAYIKSWTLCVRKDVPYLLKQLTIALPERLPVILAPARAMVLAVSLRLSRMAPILSMWLPLALKLPVSPPTLPSPILGLWRASATEVVSRQKGGRLVSHGSTTYSFLEHDHGNCPWSYAENKDL